jgi:hypothetical protein
MVADGRHVDVTMGWFTTPPSDDRRIDSLLELLAAERERCAIAEGRATELGQQLAIANNHFEWARTRLNQIEAERAMLLGHFLKIPILPMQLARDFEGGDHVPAMGISFEDMGDDAARAEGLDREPEH